MTPTVDFNFYSTVYQGLADESTFNRALISASAQLVEITGEDIPQKHAKSWQLALCSLIDWDTDSSKGVQSEHVGATSVTYSQEYATRCAIDNVRPYLAHTGLLYQGV